MKQIVLVIALFGTGMYFINLYIYLGIIFTSSKIEKNMK